MEDLLRPENIGNRYYNPYRRIFVDSAGPAQSQLASPPVNPSEAQVRRVKKQVLSREELGPLPKSSGPLHPVRLKGGWDWEVLIMASRGYSFRTLSSTTENQALTDKRNESEQPMAVWHWTIMGGLPVGEQTVLRSGLIVRTYQERTSFRVSRQDTVWDIRNQVNTYKALGIPFYFGQRYQRGPFSMEADFGLGLDVLTRTRALVPGDSSVKRRTLEDVRTPIPFAAVQLQLNWKLSHEVGLGLVPQFHFALGSRSKEINWNEKPWFMGLGFSTHVKF